MKLKRILRSVAAILASATPVLLSTGGVSLAATPGTGADCVVGTAGYPTIQSAVDNPGCETISVPAGTFRENVLINGTVIDHTNITIRGAGPAYTIVDGSNAPGAVFSVVKGRRAGPCGEPEVAVTLQGMTITGGTSAWCPPDNPRCTQRNGGGVAGAPGTKLIVKNCTVSGNSAYMNGGGISVAAGRLTVLDSVVSGNTAYGNPQPDVTDPNYIGGGGGIRIAGCPGVLIVSNSVIERNVSHRHGGGILSFTRASAVTTPTTPPVTMAFPAGTLVVEGSDIKNNTAADANGGGGVFYDAPDLTLIKGKVKNNYPDDLRPGATP